jgi:hypothetical protein
MNSKASSDLGEQALSKAAEIGLSTQLDHADALDVEIHTNPVKLAQGELESVSITGEGLVMKQELRTEALEVKTDNIAINPLKAVFGQIELLQPTNASAFVVLNEQDIDRAFNSDYIQNKLKNLTVKQENQPTTVNINHIKFCLPGDRQVSISAEVFLVETQETKQIAFTAIPHLNENGYNISLEIVQEPQGQEVAPELREALLKSFTELLDLRNFELGGMSLRLQQLDLEVGKMILKAEATVEEFPSS